MPESATLGLEEMVIEFGPLDITYGKLDSRTISTGTQISAERVTNEELRDVWFYTANAGLARKRNGKLELGIGGRAAFNVVFGYDTERTCKELKDTGYAHLNPYQRDAILELERLGEIVFANEKDLQLKGTENEYRSFPIRTTRYDKDVTTARQPFVHAGFGSGVMLDKVMENLRTNGNISETGVYTMNPDHAAENVQENEIVARASRVDGFGVDSWFCAVERDVVDLGNGLRGVLKSAEGAAPQIDPAIAYNHLLRNEDLAVKVMSGNPMYQQRVAGILARSLQNQK